MPPTSLRNLITPREQTADLGVCTSVDRPEKKEKLEKDLERYNALLRLVTDARAVAALHQLIRETMERLRHINNSKNEPP